MNKKEDLIEEHRQLVRAICDTYQIEPTSLAKNVGVAHSTFTRLLSPSAKNALSALTLKKLFEKYPASPQNGKNNKARELLGTAIKLWFESEITSVAAIHSLALDAYKLIYPDQYVEGVEKERAEWLILSVITEIQLQDEQLTDQEIAFLIWLSANDTTLSKNEGRVFSAQLIQAENGANIGKPDKLAFFKAFTAKRRTNGK